MDGLNIVVTGASQGIGFEVARQLAKLGNNNIVAIARNAQNLQQLKNACIKENIQAHLYPIPFDLNSKEPYSEDLLPKIRQHFEHIDILINNAGYLVNKEFEDIDDEHIEAMMGTNFMAMAKLTRMVIPLMKQHGGHVVSISSMGAFQGSMKFKGLSVYSASKAAVASLTECLAEEYKHTNMVFNCLALGATDTEMFRTAFPSSKAPHSAAEIASFIVDFALNGKKFFNGKILPVTTTTP